MTTDKLIEETIKDYNSLLWSDKQLKWKPKNILEHILQKHLKDKIIIDKSQIWDIKFEWENNILLVNIWEIWKEYIHTIKVWNLHWKYLFEYNWNVFNISLFPNDNQWDK